MFILLSTWVYFTGWFIISVTCWHSISSFVFWTILCCLQINVQEFTDLCNAIALRFQKEDTVSGDLSKTCESYIFIVETEVLKLKFGAANLCAAILVWKVPFILPFSRLWEVEGFYSEPQIRIHNILHTHNQSICCYRWNYGEA